MQLLEFWLTIRGLTRPFTRKHQSCKLGRGSIASFIPFWIIFGRTDQQTNQQSDLKSCVYATKNPTTLPDGKDYLKISVSANLCHDSNKFDTNKDVSNKCENERIFLNFLEFCLLELLFATKNWIIWVPWCFIVLRSPFPWYLRNAWWTKPRTDPRTDGLMDGQSLL